MKVVKFAYYDEFYCIGPECPDSCCKHWRITLSKREYLNYKKMNCSPELKEIINNAFVRIKKYGSDLNYAQMKLKENGDCPFLGSDCLCKIQKELGENALDRVCSSYPRLIGFVGAKETVIYSCDMTCPHVVELLMSHPEGLKIVEEEYDGKNKYVNSSTSSMKSTPNTWEGYPYYWIIKSAQIDILQNRNFTISERLLILGFFCQKTEEYLKNNQGEKIQGLANMLLDNETYRKIAVSLKAPQSDESRAAKSLDIFYKLSEQVQIADCSEMLRERFKTVAEYIELTTTIIDEHKSSVLCNKTKHLNAINFFKKIESERPYIFENLLVNQIFIQAPSDGIWLNYFALAVFYNLLKTSISAFLPNNWTDRDLALAISYTTKMIINTHLADKGTASDFIGHNSFDLPHAAFLIS